MKGIIDNFGYLVIIRAGKPQGQRCPWTGVGDFTHLCGDWCPHFGEPEIDAPLSTVYLKICFGKLWVFNEFKDER